MHNRGSDAVIRCEHGKCESCGYPLWKEFDIIDGEVVGFIYDDSNEDSEPLERCPECKTVLIC